MSAPEYRRIYERLRELATRAQGSMRAIPLGRFDEDLPEGLTHDEQTRRTSPDHKQKNGQPRVEVRPIKLRKRLHPPTGSKQVRNIEVELRVVRALPLKVVEKDDARYDEHGLATEDGELLARVIELPANLERTAAGELTGCRSLVHQGSDGRVVAPRGTERAQRIETIHRFRGFVVVDTPT